MRGEAVVVSRVTMGYGSGADVVRGVSVEVAPGETLALLGPSGCGKTSLLRAVAGLERIRSGTIAIGSRTVSGPEAWVRPEQRQVGMVFQDGALFPHLSVARNVAFGLRSLGRVAARRRVDEVLELVELAGFGDRLPGTLSGGQQQRVALARSLAPSPSVLLLDEPFSALDAALRVQVRTEVARLLREIGVTTVFVTHDQDEAFVLGDRVAVMRAGEVEQIGSPEELYQRPATPWVAGFVGEANLLPGRVEPVAEGCGGGEGTTVARTALGPVPLLAPSAAGAEVLVLVRPEQVTVVPGSGAVVDLVEYYGHDVRYDLVLPDGGTVKARGGSGVTFPRGTRVGVGFQGPAAVAWSADTAPCSEPGPGTDLA